MARGKTEKQTYLSFQAGKVVERVPEGTEGAVSRKITKGKNDGKLVWEIHDDFLEGYLTSIKKEHNPEFGPRWKFEITDENETFVVELPYSSGYAKSFMFAIEGADLKQPIRFVPKMVTKEGKDKHYLNLFQHPYRESLSWNYTKANPNGLPDMVVVKVKGVEQWDDTDQLEFLEDMLNKKIIPNLLTVSQAQLSYQSGMPDYAKVEPKTGPLAGAPAATPAEKPAAKRSTGPKAGENNLHSDDELRAMTEKVSASTKKVEVVEEVPNEPIDFNDGDDDGLPF